jgi:hypothetical protein
MYKVTLDGSINPYTCKLCDGPNMNIIKFGGMIIGKGN